MQYKQSILCRKMQSATKQITTGTGKIHYFARKSLLPHSMPHYQLQSDARAVTAYSEGIDLTQTWDQQTQPFFFVAKRWPLG
jgi:hypothetical protein